jgi:protein-S-isoprenylcysteine O-methyltransferase Ste14
MRRYRSPDRQPAWWALYGIFVLAAALLGLVMLANPPDFEQTVLDSAIVVVAFSLAALWAYVMYGGM